MKKTITTLALAGAITFSGFAAAPALAYAPVPPASVSTTTPALGQTVSIVINGLEEWEGQNVTFALSGGSGATLASIVQASSASTSVFKTVVGGSASADFTATVAGDYTVTVYDPNGNAISSVSFAAGSTAGGGSDASGADALPATGSDVPLGAIWLGVGAVGIGGIAVTAAVARRRSAAQR
ncbi:hypothetical protein ACWPKO_25480 (plasmid) [Coraliomargarita sp. W4R53]